MRDVTARGTGREELLDDEIRFLMPSRHALSDSSRAPASRAPAVPLWKVTWTYLHVYFTFAIHSVSIRDLPSDPRDRRPHVRLSLRLDRFVERPTSKSLPLWIVSVKFWGQKHIVDPRGIYFLLFFQSKSRPSKIKRSRVGRRRQSRATVETDKTDYTTYWKQRDYN